jgi:ISXO2 transposase-like protein
VFTLVERGGEARSRHVANVSAETIRPLIVTVASRKSHLRTDESGVYWAIGEEFKTHKTVVHSADEYVRDDVHTNTVEGYFAILKRGIYGTYHHVSEAHLHRYLAEFDFRYSNRSKLRIEDAERAATLLRGVKGKRLLYRQPDEAANA